jgi:hypothetical protein
MVVRASESVVSRVRDGRVASTASGCGVGKVGAVDSGELGGTAKSGSDVNGDGGIRELHDKGESRRGVSSSISLGSSTSYCLLTTFLVVQQVERGLQRSWRWCRRAGCCHSCILAAPTAAAAAMSVGDGDGGLQEM